LIRELGEVAGQTSNLVTVQGHLAFQKADVEFEELAVFPTPIKRYVSPLSATLRTRRNIFLGFGFGCRLMQGTSPSVRNFALMNNAIIVNSQNQARDYCTVPEEMVFVPNPRGAMNWSVNIGGLRVLLPSDSVRRQARSTIQRFKIDSFSRKDIVPQNVYTELVRELRRFPGVQVEEQSGSTLVRNCDIHMQHFPTLEYRITDDAGNHVITVLMDPEDYLLVVRLPEDTSPSNSCELQIAPTTAPTQYTLGVNLYKHLLVYFERNPVAENSRIGFCDPLME
jgi:hypothetical protein